MAHANVSAGRISSLLAIAIVRRLLLELKVPEGQDPARLFGQPIEAWVISPVEDFDGQTPAQMLGAPGGGDIVRSWLEERRPRTSWNGVSPPLEPCP